MIDLVTCKKIINANIEGFADSTRTIVNLLFWLTSVIILLFAVSLAWGCNKGGERILMVIIAILLPYLYLIGYLIYHKILGYPCSD